MQLLALALVRVRVPVLILVLALAEPVALMPAGRRQALALELEQILVPVPALIQGKQARNPVLVLEQALALRPELELEQELARESQLEPERATALPPALELTPEARRQVLEPALEPVRVMAPLPALLEARKPALEPTPETRARNPAQELALALERALGSPLEPERATAPPPAPERGRKLVLGLVLILELVAALVETLHPPLLEQMLVLALALLAEARRPGPALGVHQLLLPRQVPRVLLPRAARMPGLQAQVLVLVRRTQVVTMGMTATMPAKMMAMMTVLVPTLSETCWHQLSRKDDHRQLHSMEMNCFSGNSPSSL